MRGLIYHGSLLAWRYRRPLLIVGALIGIVVILSRDSHGQTIANALAQVNAHRAARGLYALQLDIRLQAAAEHDAAWRARTSTTGHLGFTPMLGRAEGVGWSSGVDHWGQRFHSCYHTSGRGSPPYTRTHRYAGAAVATNGRGSFYTLQLR